MCYRKPPCFRFRPIGLGADGIPGFLNLFVYKSLLFYLSSMRATSVLVLAWASIDADACTRTWYFARFVLSVAISTSLIRPLAAIMLVFCNATSSAACRNLDIEPPLSARKVAMFWIAWVNTPTDTSVRSMTSLISAAAKERTCPVPLLWYALPNAQLRLLSINSNS